MGSMLALVALSLVGFGGGILCGFLLFRRGPAIAVTLPESALAEPIEALQRTIIRFDRQLSLHVERMTQGVGELQATDITSSPLVKLLDANQEFHKQLSTFAADVRQAGSDLGTIGPSHDNREDASPATAAPAMVAQGPTEAVPSKFRAETRHPFPCKQWVAQYSGVRAPEAEEFFRVQCRDISSGGISFFLNSMPSFQMVVIRLAGPLEPRYLTAQIQRTSPSGNPEHGRYVVGCKFLGTVHRSALPSGLEASIQRREVRTAGGAVAIA